MRITCNPHLSALHLPRERRLATTASQTKTSAMPLTMRSPLRTPERTQTAGSSSARTGAGNLLEVVVLVATEGAQLAIHAMRMRAKYRRLIER